MTAAGLYGLFRGLRALRREREHRRLASLHWDGWGAGENMLGEALREVARRTLDKTPRRGVK